ncbi:MAG: hypothetical protein AB7T63_12370 [Planctomycetota bacterium]
MSERHPSVRSSRRAVCLGAFAVLAAAAGLVAPTLVGTARAEESRARWILDLKHGPLKTVAVPDGAGGTTSYHYMVLEVTNATGHGRHWYPLFKVATDTDKSYVAGGCPLALQAIRREERDPDLVSLESTVGLFPNGKTLRMAAIFGPVDPLYDRITLQLHGLVDPIAIFRIEKYGDTEIVADSVYYDRNQKLLEAIRAETEDGQLPAPEIEYREVRENRYWQMVYERLGDEFHAEDDHITFVSEGWRADGELKVLRVFGKSE